VPEAVEVAVVGGGQAGLSLSHELSHAAVLAETIAAKTRSR